MYIVQYETLHVKKNAEETHRAQIDVSLSTG